MKPSHIVLLLAVGLLCAATLIEARGRRGPGGRGRGGGGRGRGGPPRGPRKVLACSVSPGTDEKECGESSSCTAGPIDVVFDGEDVAVTFCDRPYKPKREDVCKITDAEGNEIEPCHELKECADGETCIVGPIESPHRGHKLYLCGTENVLPTVNYVEILKEKACGVGTDLDEDACGDHGSCTGPTVIVDSDLLTFCVRDDDEETEDDRTLLDLLNHARRGKKRSSEEEEDDDDDDDDDCDHGRRGSDESEGSEGEGEGRDGRGGRGARGGPGRGRGGRGRPGRR